MPLPERVPGNHYRVYDELDVADVLWMRQQIESGISPSQASLALQRQRYSRHAGLDKQMQPIDEAFAVILDAFVQADETWAHQILDESFAQFTLEQVVQKIIQPTMYEIGERWMRKEITV